MGPPTLDLLSTGEVARLCGVSRDAVLKWIKRGKLPATQTPGGHYRVPRSACEELSFQDRHLETTAANQTPAMKEAEIGTMRCWEYFGDSGTPREACESCLVYLARAQKCYRLAELGKESGHQLHFCRNDCRTCAYYRACQGLAAEVLIISRDLELARRLEMQGDPERISIRFARSGYESSAILSSFSPALIILDGELPEVKSGQLPESILEDGRIPAAQVVVACGEDEREAFRDRRLRTLPRHFTTKELENLAATVVGARTRLPLDVA
jgi:excisionase family DNA binding protein